MKGARAIGFWVLCAAFAALPAAAQTPESPTITLPHFEDELPSGGPSEMPSGVPDPSALLAFSERRAESAAPAPPAERRMPLVGPLGSTPIMRLSGESAAVDTTLYLPPSVAATGFQLSLRTSIHALPERSFVTVIVNDEALPPIRTDSFDGFTPVVLESGLLKPGENRVRIESHLYHRIYCGPEASFALWVEVDTANSGLILPAAYVPEIADVPHLMVAQSALPKGLGLRAAPNLASQALNQLAGYMMGALGRSVSVVSAYAPTAAGAPDLLRVTVLPGDTAAADLVTGGDGVAVLRVRLPDSGADLAAILPPMAQAMPDVAALEPGVPTALHDLGRNDTADRGHYIRHDIAFRLPSDWLVLGPQTSRFTLAYSFANRLAKGALLFVKVNGTTVRLLPLDISGGDAQPPLTIGFKASLLHPGVNALTLEAIIPGDPPDLPCVGNDGPVLSIGGASTLLVPPTPSMQFPGIDLALSAATGAQVSRGMGGGVGGGTADLPFLPIAFTPLQAASGVGAQTTLNVRLVSAADVNMIRPVDFDLPRGLVEAVIMPATVDPEAAPPVSVPLVDFGRLTRWLSGVGPFLKGIIRPGDVALQAWTLGLTGQMVLIQPNPEAPFDLWLVLAPNVTEADAIAALLVARKTAQGPAGRLAVLDEDGNWQSWQPAATPPTLLEPLTLQNTRFILGTYASWSPVLFMLAILGLAAVTIVIAIIFVMTTRGRRKQ